jgi:hypothetical protein
VESASNISTTVILKQVRSGAYRFVLPAGLSLGYDPAPQFLGLAPDGMVFTLVRPARIKTLREIAAELPKIIWLGGIFCKAGTQQMAYHIPKHVWCPTGTAWSGTHHFRGYIYSLKRGLGPFNYSLLKIPAITQKGIL